MKVNANTLRKGNVIDHNGRLWMVVDHMVTKPGKGGALAQIELRDIRSGTKDNVRFRTQETVDRIRLEQEPFQFLYADGNDYHFMHPTTFEQVMIDGDLIGEPQKFFLQENMQVELESYEGEHLAVTLPSTVTMEITEAEPVVKGQTASSSYKPAELENGQKIMVPPHVGAGIRVVVKTEDGSYVERAKD